MRKKIRETEERIAALEAEQAAFEEKMAAPDFFARTGEAVKADMARYDAVKREISEAYAAWEKLSLEAES